MNVKHHVLKQQTTLFGHQAVCSVVFFFTGDAHSIFHEQEVKHIPPGSYSWPFRFALPKKLPPTYTHHALDYGATSYKVVAFVEYGAVKLPRKVTLPFNMNVCFSAFDEPARFIKTGVSHCWISFISCQVVTFKYKQTNQLLKAPRTKLDPETVKMEVSILSPVVNRGTWARLRVVSLS